MCVYTVYLIVITVFIYCTVCLFPHITLFDKKSLICIFSHFFTNQITPQKNLLFLLKQYQFTFPNIPFVNLRLFVFAASLTIAGAPREDLVSLSSLSDFFLFIHVVKVRHKLNQELWERLQDA